MPKNLVATSSEPLVSIIMNCFNGEKYLREAVESILNQTYQNWEVIFWDNQSVDDSAAIFKEYNDPRFKYFYAHKHTWLYEARSYAIERSRGDFIAFLDVDDIWLPNKLTEQLILFSDSDIGMVCGNYFLKNESNNKKWLAIKNYIPTGWVLDQLLQLYFVGLLTLIVRRSALESLDYGCDPKYHIMGDLDLVIRLSVRWKLDAVQEAIAVCRKHGNNELVKHRQRHIDELGIWIKEMSDIKEISFNSSFHYVKNNHIYQKAMNCILRSLKLKAFKLSLELPWGRMKFRLWLVILTPMFIIQKLKNIEISG